MWPVLSFKWQVKKLVARPDPTSVLATVKNLGLKRCFILSPVYCVPSFAWMGVYLLGYFGFSIGWMVTPLLFR